MKKVMVLLWCIVASMAVGEGAHDRATTTIVPSERPSSEPIHQLSDQELARRAVGLKYELEEWLEEHAGGRKPVLSTGQLKGNSTFSGLIGSGRADLEGHFGESARNLRFYEATVVNGPRLDRLIQFYQKAQQEKGYRSALIDKAINEIKTTSAGASRVSSVAAEEANFQQKLRQMARILREYDARKLSAVGEAPTNATLEKVEDWAKKVAVRIVFRKDTDILTGRVAWNSLGIGGNQLAGVSLPTEQWLARSSSLFGSHSLDYRPQYKYTPPPGTFDVIEQFIY